MKRGYETSLLQVVDVSAFSPSLVEVLHAGPLSKDGVSDLGQLSVNIESKSSESLDVDTPSGAQLLIQVGYEAPPNDEHLSFGLERLLVSDSPLSGSVVFARIVVTILEDPTTISSASSKVHITNR